VEVVPLQGGAKAEVVAVHVDLRGVDARADDLGPGGVDVAHDEAEPWSEPGGMSTAGTGAPGQSKMRVPMAIEQPDPGGVNWTNRVSSSWVESKSTWKPSRSA
jgi:hypothetical protein